MAPPITAVTMPKWGIEMTEGSVTSWRVAEGARVERGAELVDVETEKIVNTVEAAAAGTLRRILAADGDTLPVGALLGVIADEQASDAQIAEFVNSFVGAAVSFDPPDATAPATSGASTAAATATAPTGQTPPTPATAAAPSTGPAAASGDETSAGSDETRVSPIARRVAERLGVDLSQVAGTGRNGRISKEDVEAYAARGATAPGASPAHSPASAMADSDTRPAPAVPAAGVRRVRMSARRLTIARRLLEAKQTVPHYRLELDADFGPLLRLQRTRVAAGADRVSINDWLLRAVGLALIEHPSLNAQLEGEDILQFEAADIAIAVAAEAGLVTPILRAVNLKPIEVIARESRDLIARARQGTLRREEITGGSFTVSNLGTHGVTRFDAIINIPQVAILAVGSVSQRAVVVDGALGIGDVCSLTLSLDHRVVDGAAGSAFLKTVRALLREPAAL
jgi:pyruvate dehydrogenase E2 component (dihydrolipoamide acetyltransferase)